VAFACLILVVGLVQIGGHRFIGVNGGVGWDGVQYAAIARNPVAMFSKGVDLERQYRVLPSLLVHASLRSIGARLVDSNVVLAFAVMNLATTILCVGVWSQISRRLRPSAGSLAAITGLLLLNFLNLRQAFANPVTTDHMGLLLAFLFLWAYLRRSWDRYLWLFVSFFTWPGITLLAVPRLVLRPTESDRGAVSVGTRKLASIAFGCLLAACALAYYLSLVVYRFRPGNDRTQIATGWLLLSMAAAVIYLAFALNKPVIRVLEWLSTGLIDKVNWRGTGTVVGLYLASRFLGSYVHVAQGKGHGHFPDYLTMFVEGGSVFVRSATMPLVFAVSHLMYFGPLFIFCLLAYPRIVGSRSPAELVCIGVNMFFLLNSESRHLLQLMPFFAYWWLEANKDATFDWRKTSLALALAVVGSKVWVPLDHITTTSSYLRFPNQYLFMNYGPWMSPEIYVLALAAGVGIVWVVRRMSRGRQLTPRQRQVQALTAAEIHGCTS
jgi:hypothetical protein